MESAKTESGFSLCVALKTRFCSKMAENLNIASAQSVSEFL